MFKALSNPNRLRLFMNLLEESKLDLAKGRVHDCFLAKLLGGLELGAPTVSHHVKELADAGSDRDPARGQAAHLLRRSDGLAELRAALTARADPARRASARPFCSHFTVRQFRNCHRRIAMSHRDIAIEKYGAASTLHLRDIAPRPPGRATRSRSTSRTRASNFADIQMRLGFYPDAPKRPFVPGYEVSGMVAAVGKNVTDLAAGDAVVAGTYFGGYASHVTIPARQVFKLPAALDLAAGAALPVNYFTAQLALFEMARVRAGDRVLIECATGGVGVLAMQMARHAGAEVTGLTTSAAQEGVHRGARRDRVHASTSSSADPRAARLRLHPQRVGRRRDQVAARRASA